MPEDIFENDVEVETDIPENAIVNEYRSKITIGDVETLDYGEDAYVTNTGTAEDPVLNFGLPQGASGSLWGQIDGTLADQEDLADALSTINTAIALKAPLASPALTGTPTAPTAADSTNTTQIATTAFVQNAVAILKNYIDTAVANVLRHINFSGAVASNLSNTTSGDYVASYTCTGNGYIVALYAGIAANSYVYLAVNSKQVLPRWTNNSSGTAQIHNGTGMGTLIPVSSGDVCTRVGGGTISIVFFPEKAS